MCAHHMCLFVKPCNKIFIVLSEFYVFHVEMDTGSFNVALDTIMEFNFHINKLKDRCGYNLFIKLSLFLVEFVMI